MQALIDQGIVIPAAAPRSLPARRVRLKGSLTDLVADQRR
jgi:hypothetical protein